MSIKFKKDLITLAEVHHLPLTSEILYKNKIIAKFVNCLMMDGKKAKAEKVMLNCFTRIRKYLISVNDTKFSMDPRIVFKRAIENTIPIIEIKNVRQRRSSKQVPAPIPVYRRLRLSIRWIIDAASSYRLRGRGKKSNVTLKKKKQSASAKKPMSERLFIELLKAANGIGKAVEKKNDLHKRAYAKRAFANFKF